VARSGRAGGPRASRWEIVGSWLRIWTPPRDVEIPPPPRRALAVAAVLLAAAVVAVVTLVAPAIDRSKARAAAQRERAAAVEVRARRAQLTFDQRAHHARAPEVARLYAAGRAAASRAALLADVRASIDRDVRARVAAGELKGPIRDVRCRYRPRERGVRVHLDCLAATAGATHRRVLAFLIGHPFVVGGSLRDGRYAWCKDNPRPGERAIGRSVTVALPAACSG
jgi:hypothetical protein